MKKPNIILSGCFWLWAVALQAQPEASVPDSLLKRCATPAYEQLLQLRDPARKARIERLNRQVTYYMARQSAARAVDTTLYRIPVVVHVIHSNAAGQIGGPGNGNISDEQIKSQIEVLNEDYRRKPGTNGYNTNPIGADAHIEFFLAQTDPDGRPATGITRHYYAQKSTFDIYNDDSILSAIAHWPSDRYLNIWVTTLSNDYLGVSSFPEAADSLRGLPFPKDVNYDYDGVKIDHRFFGRQTGTIVSKIYNLGRTATHEIGHWLGLLHTWGDGNCDEDYVYDTPPTQGPNQTTQCRTTYSTCFNGVRTRDLTEDFLDYSPDACMNLFTAGQVARMRAVLKLSPQRLALINSLQVLPDTDRLTVGVLPNPTEANATFATVQFKGNQTFTMSIFDMQGRLLTTVSYPNSPSIRIALPVENLSAGLYVVRIQTATESVSNRVLIR